VKQDHFAFHVKLKYFSSKESCSSEPRTLFS
jgi:hypothetical protein